MLQRTIRIALAALLALAPAAAAQPTAARPFLDWRTVDTRHFTIDYPAGMQDFALDIASRIDAVGTAVSAMVGNTPSGRTTIVVEDPLGVSNGFALPFLRAPEIFFWPTPPGPRSAIGDNRSWGEVLSVHEFTHIAHLTRPSRDPMQRWLWTLLPVRLSPMTLESPRWVSEGYATYIEGRITGAGRPHGVWRPAVLRQWALEGKLPTYAEMSQWGAWQGGAFAYLAGSAYLEWLADRRGDRSLVDLWKRMTARKHRGFDEAFTGVYGDSPEDLYQRFTVDVTARALAIDSALHHAGLVEGEMVQRESWSTGDPAVSADGKYMATVLSSPHEPGRVVVWRTAEEPEDSAALRAREREHARDTADVPAVRIYPRPKKPVAVLPPADIFAYGQPRFLRDGRRLLVTRFVPTGDGALRRDLFIWDFHDGGVRRITRLASVQDADPSPDGRSAVAVQCRAGKCGLVRVSLETGDVTTLLPGALHRSYYRPRLSADGRRVVVGVQDSSGRWRVALTDPDGAPPRFVDPDDGANRYDATFMPDGHTLVLVSEQGGIPNLALLDLTTGAERPLTRVTGAAVAPEPDSAARAVYFLSLHARGWDVRRIVPDSVRADRVVMLEPRLTPAAPVPPVRADTFAVGRVSPVRGYGLGIGHMALLPGGASTTEGWDGRLSLARSDIVGRWSWLLQGAAGSDGAWRGAAWSGALRVRRPYLHLELFGVDHRPSLLHESLIRSNVLDARYRGGDASVELWRDAFVSGSTLRIGGSAGTLHGPALPDATRRFGFAELGVRRWHVHDHSRALIALGAAGQQGRTADTTWRRGALTTALGFGGDGGFLLGELLYTGVAPGAPAWEQLVVGGAPQPLLDDAVLAQRIPMPALPIGTLAGDRIVQFRVSLPSGPFTPYWWGARLGHRDEPWHRVYGVETTLSTPPVPLAHLPAFTLTAGAARSLDAPFRHRNRGYIDLSYRP